MAFVGIVLALEVRLRRCVQKFMLEFIAKFIRQFLFLRVIFAKEGNGEIFVKFMSFINDQNIKPANPKVMPRAPGFSPKSPALGRTLRMSNMPIALISVSLLAKKKRVGGEV